MNIFAIINLAILAVTMVYPYDMTVKQKVVVLIISSLFTLFTTTAYNHAKNRIVVLESKLFDENR